MDSSPPLFWLIFTALCFALGFAFSWWRLRKQLRARYAERLQEEYTKRVAAEVLRRIAGGEELESRVRAATEEALRTAAQGPAARHDAKRSASTTDRKSGNTAAD